MKKKYTELSTDKNQLLRVLQRAFHRRVWCLVLSDLLTRTQYYTVLAQLIEKATENVTRSCEKCAIILDENVSNMYTQQPMSYNYYSRKRKYRFHKSYIFF